MRNFEHVKDMRLRLYRMRQLKGEYLLDIEFKLLTPEAKRELTEEARVLVNETNFDVRRVSRGGVKVWRFVERG